MMKILRFLVCFLVSFAAVYLGGYGNLVNDVSPPLAVYTFLGVVIVLSIITFLLWEMYLSLKAQISELSSRVVELEEKNKILKKLPTANSLKYSCRQSFLCKNFSKSVENRLKIWYTYLKMPWKGEFVWNMLRLVKQA